MKWPYDILWYLLITYLFFRSNCLVNQFEAYRSRDLDFFAHNSELDLEEKFNLWNKQKELVITTYIAWKGGIVQCTEHEILLTSLVSTVTFTKFEV